MTDSIERLVQTFSPGDFVELFKLDATSLGGTIYYFTPYSDAGAKIQFNNVLYTPIDMETDGWEWNGKGALPTPRIRVSNANLAFNAAAVTYGDLVGATITRTRTFRQFLDGEADSDPTQTFPLDVYVVNRKINHNKVFIEWELSSPMDQEGKIIPGRQILKDICTHRYRSFDTIATDSFDYTKSTCPYVGTSYFDAQGNTESDPANDVCGKKMSDCRLRFGTNGVLPFRGFPGITKF